MRHLSGLQRDVYEMNLLGTAHLAKRVERKTLKKWIESTPEHGRLAPLNRNIWEWRVPNRYRPKVRRALVRVGLLIADRQDCGDE